MAYNVTEEEKNLFRSRYRQIALIKIDGTEKIMNLTEADIVKGGLSVDRYCFSSSSFEIGTAISSELSLELSNADGRFDNEKFEGAKITVSIGIKKWDSPTASTEETHWVKLGRFTVDDKEKRKSSILLKALDDMVRFDKPYQTDLAYPATLAQIASDACNKCGVLLQTEGFYNSDYTVNTKPTGNDITFRQVIQWVAQISATNAFIDWNGKLNFKFFAKPSETKPSENGSVIVVPKSDRYESDVAEEAAVITGVKVTTVGGEPAMAGSDGTVLVVEGNGLIQSVPSAVADAIFLQVKEIQYFPYRAKCRPMPYLYPMDMIKFEPGGENTIVSHVTYTMNGATLIAGEGQGKVKGGYASLGSVTTQERAIIDSVKKESETTDKSRIDSALQLNQIISSAFGLYRTEMIDGKVSKWYFHDKKTLKESGIIYTFNSGGFAWTDEGWNNGNPVWKNGFTQDGNAVFKILSAYKIQAEYIDTTNLKVNSANIENGSITNLKIGDKAIGGFTMTAGQLRAKYKVSGSGATEKFEYAGISSMSTPHITSPSEISLQSIVNPNIGSSSSLNYSPVRFFAGAPKGTREGEGSGDGVDMSQSKFAVLEDGSLYAKAAKIEGDIKSSSGEITAGEIRSTGNISANLDISGHHGNFQKLDVGSAVRIGKHIIKAGGRGTQEHNYQIEMVGHSMTGGTVSFDLKCLENKTNVAPKEAISGLIWFNYLLDNSEMGYEKAEFSLSSESGTFSKSFGKNIISITNISISPSNFTYVEENNEALSFSTNLLPNIEGTVNNSPNSQHSLGSANALWSDVYATNGVINTSDRNQKNTILPISDKYSMLFDKLKPVSFKFNDGQSGRTHIGMISQDVELALAECGIETKDFAGFVKSHENETGKDFYSLRYTEFIPMCIKEIQTLKTKIKELEKAKNGK